MRVVFMGTPELAATVLSQVVDAFDVVGVYSRPDAVRGRGKKLVASPVKELACGRGIPVFTPTTMRDGAAIEQLRSLEPDVICIVAYGAILPKEVLDIPRFGCVNVHTSLLPRWRGAAPMQRAILACDEVTGVSIMRVEEGLDTGPCCAQLEIALDGLYLSELEHELGNMGGQALVDALKSMQGGSLEWFEQSSEGVTYASKLEKGELALDPGDEAAVTCAKVRASSAAHPAHAELAGRGVTVERASLVVDAAGLDLASGLSQGQATFRGKRLFVQAADAPIEILQLKPDGKKSMDARSFAAGIQGIKNSTITWGRA